MNKKTLQFLHQKTSLKMASASTVFSPCFFRQKIPSTCKFRPTRVSGSYTSSEKTRSVHLCSSDVSSPASLYEVLGISKGATSQEIKTAYRRLARLCHPDAVAFDRKETSADQFMKIHAAYSTLADHQKRADYDRDLDLDLFNRKGFYRSSSTASDYAASSASSSSMSGYSSYTRRNWETDQCW